MDEVLEEIPSPYVRFSTKLGTLLFVATIALIILFQLLNIGIKPLKVRYDETKLDLIFS